MNKNTTKPLNITGEQEAVMQLADKAHRALCEGASDGRVRMLYAKAADASCALLEKIDSTHPRSRGIIGYSTCFLLIKAGRAKEAHAQAMVLLNDPCVTDGHARQRLQEALEMSAMAE